MTGTEPLERAFASTRGVLANVEAGQYSNPTPCESWDVQQLVSHFVGASHWYGQAMGSGEAGESEDSDIAPSDALAVYDGGIAAALAAFRAPGAPEKMVKLPFGEFPGSIVQILATSDSFVHGWDLAKATGQSTDLDPELATQLLEGARQMLPDEFRGDDGVAPFGPVREPSDGATAADQLAAFMGRRVTLAKGDRA